MSKVSEKAERTVTTALEWRKAREVGVIETLPSGNVAQLRTLSLLRLLERGTIPDALSGIIQEMMGGLKLSMGRVKCALLSLDAMKQGLRDVAEM